MQPIDSEEHNIASKIAKYREQEVLLHIANPTRILGRPGGRKVMRKSQSVHSHAQACPVVFRAGFVALRAVQPYQVSRSFKGFWLGIAGGTFTLSIAPSTYRILRKRYKDFCCMSYLGFRSQLYVNLSGSIGVQSRDVVGSKGDLDTCVS